MMNIFKKSKITETVYKVDSLPYIYQSEYYSLAWGLKHKGFFVDPKGITYSYNMPKDWRFYTSEINNSIRRQETERLINNIDGYFYINAKGIKFEYNKPDEEDSKFHALEASKYEWHEKGDTGFYIDKQGIKQEFYKVIDERYYISLDTNKNPVKVWGDETDGLIAPEDLFRNLQNSTKDDGLFTLRKTNPINQEIIESLKTSPIEDCGQVRIDAGILSNSILVYDPSVEFYKRVLLSVNGDRSMINKSRFTKDVIDSLGQIFNI